MGESVVQYPCPECGSACDWECDCPGYERRATLMMCYPPCCNAALWFCSRCDWKFRIPNRRPDARGKEPEWMYDPTNWLDDDD